MRTLTLALLVAALVPTGTALGAQGDLDPTFDGDGARAVGALVNADAVAIQPDGKTVVVGPGSPSFAFAVTRLHRDGSTDIGFGEGGLQIVDHRLGVWHDVALQSDGKIVAVAAGGLSVLRIARLGPDGSPDTTFGAGGMRTIDLGGSAEGAEAVAIQPDGKILVAGYGSADKAFVVVRLHADGSLDAGFADGGVRRVDVVPGLMEEAHALALQADGKIVVAGEAHHPVQPIRDIALARLDANGSPDLMFGSGGSVRIPGSAFDVARGLAIQPDGKILLATRSGAVRLNADGTADARQPAASGQAEALAVLPNGKVLVAGEGFAPPGGGRGGGIGRLLPDLQLDRSFGGPFAQFLGLRSIDVFGPLTFYAMALGPDGRITLAGHLTDPRAGAVVRLEGDAAAPSGPGPAGAPRPAGGPGTIPRRRRCAGRVATIVGGDGRDVLRGTRSADVIVGLGGNDVVRAASGDDVMCGGRGRDRLYGGRGRDRLLGQSGRDTLAGGRGRDVLAGGPNRDSCADGPVRRSCEIRPGPRAAMSR